MTAVTGVPPSFPLPVDDFFRAIVERSGAALLVWEESLIYANPTACRMLGYEFDQLFGRAPGELFAPDPRLEESGSHTAFEIRHGDGAVRPIETNFTHFEQGGKLLTVAAISPPRPRDDTWHLLKMLNKAFETTQLGVTITDPSGEILFTNQAEADMHGYEIRELIGRDVRIFAPKTLWNPMDKSRLRDLSRRRRETVNIRRDGAVFPVQLRSDVVTDESGEPIAMVTICEDITERKKAEESRAQLEAQLRQAQKMEAVGQLAGGIAHDFNNMLVVIHGHVELARDFVEPGSDLADDLARIGRAADQAGRLTRQLLAFSRRQILEPTDLSVNRVIEEVLGMLRRVIHENIEVCFDAGDGVPIVNADPGQIEQVILNLCVNARDAMHDGGRLRIATSGAEFDDAFCAAQPWAKPGAWAKISVADTGAGIDPETLNRIFEPFFTTKQIGKGTGLGLSTVHGVVEQHGGLLNVRSTFGEGSTFEVYLPAVIREAAPIAAQTDAPRGGDETVLLAEDDDMVRNLARRILGRAGYTVLSAANGLEAVEMYRIHHERIDLVLMDMVMPVLDGLGARSQMLELDPRTRFLFTSGYSNESTRIDAAAAVDIQVIAKPYVPAKLLEKVREILDS